MQVEEKAVFSFHYPIQCAGNCFLPAGVETLSLLRLHLRFKGVIDIPILAQGRHIIPEADR